MSTYKLGDTVRKRSGSQWHGTIVGTYSTTLTPEGYAVESATEAGSVQIYPAAALEPWTMSGTPGGSTELEAVSLLSRILGAHDTKNNGAYMGEATLCPYYAEAARSIIAKARGYV